MGCGASKSHHVTEPIQNAAKESHQQKQELSEEHGNKRNQSVPPMKACLILTLNQFCPVAS